MRRARHSSTFGEYLLHGTRGPPEVRSRVDSAEEPGVRQRVAIPEEDDPDVVDTTATEAHDAERRRD